jgi:hypothetical protein
VKNTFEALVIVWDMLRMKAVKSMGEPTVNALETGADAGFSILQNHALWRYHGLVGICEREILRPQGRVRLRSKPSSTPSRTCAPQEQMLITKVIEAGIKWLLSLLIPGAGFIKAIMAIKDKPMRKHQDYRSRMIIE